MTYHLSVPVLRHSSLKPSYACIKSIRAYFASLPRPVRDEELVVVGDRLLTDIIMANRMTRKRRPDGQVSDDEKRPLVEENVRDLQAVRSDRVGPLAVWTEGLWKREASLLRTIEKGMLRGVEKWVLGPQEAAWRESLQHRFVKPVPAEVVPVKERGWARRMWERLSK